MPTVLDELKARLAEAQKRFADANAKFNQAAMALNTAKTDVDVWSGAVQAETRDEQMRAAVASVDQLSMALSEPEQKQETAPSIQPGNLEPTALESFNKTDESSNKTEIVRELLRQHPAGMTPVEIWKAVEGKFTHRPYLYSVLKRLKDREEIVLRRKKYALRTNPEETKSHIGLLQ